MDVNKHNFVAQMPQMLRNTAEAAIVSIDLEMSGIGDVQRRADGEKPTLQEFYDEVRKAAMVYTIVQVGITTLKPDVIRGKNS